MKVSNISDNGIGKTQDRKTGFKEVSLKGVAVRKESRPIIINHGKGNGTKNISEEESGT